MPVIEINKLTKIYKGNRGIIDVDLSIEEGEIFGFIGPNGAGKSTTIRTLLNFIYPTSGSAKILGKDCVTKSAEIKKYIGYVPSEINYYPNMTVQDIIKYASSFYSEYDSDRVDILCDLFEVEKSKKMRELSLGNKKKIAIIQAIISQPKILVLDEPASGLDPLMQSRLFELLEKENKKGMTVFFSSHNLTEVQKFCHRVAIIREGKIIEVNTIDKLLKSSYHMIKIKTKENISSVLSSIGAIDLTLKDNYIKFGYNRDFNILISILSKYDISDLQVTEPSLEDTFMQFYEKGDKQ